MQDVQKAFYVTLLYNPIYILSLIIGYFSM